MPEIYFDNSATTQVCEEALNVAIKAMREEYGNPSSNHHKGVIAARALSQAREDIASILGAAVDEIYFTSGGTEANNTVIMGALSIGERISKRPARVLVSAVEHPSVAVPAKLLASKGCDVLTIPVNSSGVIDLAALEELLNEDTALVSIMQVNNETGAVQPLPEAGEIIRRKSPQALFHVDGVQSFCRIKTALVDCGVDAYTASGHKIHAPKGCGLLWLNKRLHLPSLLNGGGQERNFRSGTENMPGILSFTAAAKLAHQNMAANDKQMRSVKAALINGLHAQLDNVVVNGPEPDNAAPHILNLSFVGARSEVLLHYFEQQGLYVSAGSACTSRSTKGSSILQSMGLPADRVDSALRFSFSRFNTVEEAEAAVGIIGNAVREIRSIMMITNKRH